MESQRGLTLIELLLALAAGTVLCTVALPSLTGGLEASRGADARADLLQSLATASNHAALSGVRGVLCPSADGRQCLDTPDWSAGWLVFLDDNGSRQHDPGETILKVQAALSGRVRLRSTAGRTRIVFQGNGGNAGSNVTFTLCDGRGPAKARALILSNSGGLRDGVASPDNLAQTCVR
jgi:type IV fimbrial biogenesis protein FimT